MDLQIKYQEHTVKLAKDETVLDALERAGVNVPSSCRAGACQFCLMRAVEGSPPRHSQEGLKESLRSTGHFLSCICRPEQSLICEPANQASFRGYVKIREIRPIGPDVVLVRFTRNAELSFSPGQFITLRSDQDLARSYSIASQTNQHEYFDIHVRHVPNGRLSTWFHTQAQPGDELWAEGPKGDCIYYPGRPEEPLTLVGTGTGIAPLMAIAKEALSHRHTGPISLYHGALAEDRFYLVDELNELAALHQNLSYVRCIPEGPASPDVRTGELKKIIVSELSEAKLRRVYLCGDPGLVRLLKKHIFLAGVSLSRLHADPFIGTEAKA